jgi:hypothetical protein
MGTLRQAMERFNITGCMIRFSHGSFMKSSEELLRDVERIMVWARETLLPDVVDKLVGLEEALLER